MAPRENIKAMPKLILFTFFAIVITPNINVEAQSSSCSNVILSMASCLNYVTGSAATPSTTCCSALANVVKTQPRCLCTIVNNGNGGSIGGTNINQTLALDLPKACNVETPPATRCNAAMSPFGSPESAPAPESSSVSGSKAGTSSSGKKINIDLQLLASTFAILMITASVYSM